jgi:hypothetical protein
MPRESEGRTGNKGRGVNSALYINQSILNTYRGKLTVHFVETMLARSSVF